jgi:hypothetical protein
MIKFTYSIPTLSIMGVLAFITPAAAQSVTGSATVSGNITLSATAIFFNANAGNTVANPLTPGSPNSGSFAGLSGGAIKNLPGLAAPGPLAIKSFATFNTSSGTILFDLQSVAPGTGSPAGCNSMVGSICTPAGSPLTLEQTSVSSVAISVTLKGLAYPATAGPGSAGTVMSLTVQIFSNGTIPQVLSYIAAPTGAQNSYSATLAAN